jgi:hypothetical protein
MRGLHKFALCVILCGFWAVPAEAYDWAGKAGWGNGDTGVVNRFYPPNASEPRAKLGEDWYFAKEVWAEDISNALNERAFFASESENQNLARDTNGNIRIRYEHLNLEDIKTLAKSVLVEFICITNRSDEGLTYAGDYGGWYSQFPTNGFTNLNEYVSSVTNPPRWQITNAATANSFWAWAETNGMAMPTNYFDYTPARFLGATDVGFSNSFTASGGGTNEWTTLDYGWEGMLTVLRAMQDLYIQPDGKIDNFSSSSTQTNFYSTPSGEYAGGNTLGNCSFPTINPEDITASFVGLSSVDSTFEYSASYGTLDIGPIPAEHPCKVFELASYTADERAAYLSGSRLNLGLTQSAGNAIEQIDLLLGDFQWYGAGFSLEQSSRQTGTIAQVGTEFTITNEFIFAYSLQSSATGEQLDANVESVGTTNVYLSGKQYIPKGALLACPDPDAWAQDDEGPILADYRPLLDYLDELCDSGTNVIWYVDFSGSGELYTSGSSSEVINSFSFTLIWRPTWVYKTEDL